MLSFVRRYSKAIWLVISLVLLVAIGALNFVTGYQAPVSVLYCVPVIIAGWFSDRYTPLALAALASVVWCCADIGSGHQYFSASLHAWEISSRCALFFAAAITTVALKDRQDATAARFALLQRTNRLEHQITTITEYEQQRIGRELHDGLSQYLAAVSCAMTSLRMDTERIGDPVLNTKAAEIERLLSESIKQARELARSLAPVYHSGPGLAAALEELASSVSRRIGVGCSFETSGEDAISENSTATYLYRIAQEAIDNAVKHGRAHDIELRLSANPAAISLSVSDDGVGFSKSDKNLNGTGISVMEYRAHIVGGALSIEEGTKGGTTVSCVIPMQNGTDHGITKA